MKMNKARKSPIDPTVSFPMPMKIAFILGAGIWGWSMLLLDKILSPLARETYDK